MVLLGGPHLVAGRAANVHEGLRAAAGHAGPRCAVPAQQQAQVAVGFLQVQQARLGALETQIASARAQVAQLKRQQGQNQARSGNIRNELLGRTILDQAEGERIIRAEIQAEETRLQQEIFEAEQQLTLMQQEYDLKKLETDQIRDQIWNYLRATPTSNE